MSKENTNKSLQGITQLVTDSTISTVDLVESMHKRLLHPPLLPSTPIQHFITNISKITYKNIRWSSLFIGKSLNKIIQKISPLIGEIKSTDKQQILKSVLNGVVGDYLEEKQNPLQITMHFKHAKRKVKLNKNSLQELIPNANGKILLLVHGSCMNDISWTKNKHNHGELLAKELNKTLVYLNYNSGLHVSKNGKNFNELLENLVINWPVTLEEITVIGHSMGGLVSRSAIYYGQQHQKRWIRLLDKVIFLGTPHHGAPLEKVGNYLDVILKSIPYVKPLAPLAKIRSAGVTDLRYGNLIDEDWKGKDRFELHKDERKNIPLPQETDCYAVSAVLRKETNYMSKNILGDGLVPVKSALGKHKTETKSLNFKDENTLIVNENSHTDLLSNTKVYDRLKLWMTK